ncbi:hypothetical protein L6452_23012 [Arctium lappa]|uniref:Uncharacterized protein n=1 Tax=Arctium lappa TaxID=4217 RepID=A0ACB9B2K2_ARCLA|nr:hypothetical protein L6452_23012 [Arctium lappa]
MPTTSKTAKGESYTAARETKSSCDRSFRDVVVGNQNHKPVSSIKEEVEEYIGEGQDSFPDWNKVEFGNAVPKEQEGESVPKNKIRNISNRGQGLDGSTESTTGAEKQPPTTNDVKEDQRARSDPDGKCIGKDTDCKNNHEVEGAWGDYRGLNSQKVAASLNFPEKKNEKEGRFESQMGQKENLVDEFGLQNEVGCDVHHKVDLDCGLNIEGREFGECSINAAHASKEVSKPGKSSAAMGSSNNSRIKEIVKSKCSETIGIGRGRARFHRFKRLARNKSQMGGQKKDSKASGCGKTDRGRRKNGVSGLPKNSQSISNELKSTHESDDLKTFGGKIGLVWEGGKTEDVAGGEARSN